MCCNLFVYFVYHNLYFVRQSSNKMGDYLCVCRFLNAQVNFEDEARVKFLRLLGFSKDELERKVARCFCCVSCSY